jgi:hypothetical protein
MTTCGAVSNCIAYQVIQYTFGHNFLAPVPFEGTQLVFCPETALFCNLGVNLHYD